MSNFDDFLGYCKKHKGAIIGGLIGIVIACSGFYKVLIGIAVIVFGIIIGEYIQKNKDKVKEFLRKLIDKF